jgi:hypothetical protein
MQVRMIVFPGDEGLDVVLWGKWTQGSMRCRHFNSRSDMIAVLSSLRLLSQEEVQKLEKFDFKDSCPLYSSEVEQEVLEDHGFCHAS